MVDVAKLQISIDSTSAKTAAEALSRLNQEAAGTDKIFNRINRGTQSGRGSFGSIQRDVVKIAEAFATLKASAGGVDTALLDVAAGAELAKGQTNQLGVELLEAAAAAEILKGELVDLGANGATKLGTELAEAAIASDKLKAELGQLGTSGDKLKTLKTRIEGVAKASGEAAIQVQAVNRAVDPSATAFDKLATAGTAAGTAFNTISTSFGKVQGQFSALNASVRSGAASMEALQRRVGKLEARLRQIAPAAQKGKAGLDSVDRSAKKFGGTLKFTTNFVRQFATALGAVGIGFAFAKGLSESVRALADFEYSLQQVRAVAIDFNDTIEVQTAQFAALSAQARELGASTRFTASETADAQLFLARAGFEVNEILSATPATLSLAAAGILDLGEAADIASNVLQQFGLSTTQLEDVADTLVATANNANTNVRQLADALNYAGPFAAGLGIEVDQAASALGALGNAGIQATLAGTNLRGILVSLIKPSAQAQDVMAKLGARVGETADVFNVLENDLVDVFQAFSDSNASALDLATIFSRRNVSGANALIGQIDTWRELEDTISDATDTAQRAADIVDDSLVGAFKRLKSAATELILGFGESGLTKAIRGFVDTGVGAIRLLAGVEEGASEVTLTIKLFAGALQAAAFSLAAITGVAVLSGLGYLATQIGAASTAMRGFAFASTAATASINPFAIAGIVGAVTGLAVVLGKAEDETLKLRDRNRELARSYDEQVLPSALRAADAIERAVAGRSGDVDPTTQLAAERAALKETLALLEEVAVAQEEARFVNQDIQGFPVNRLPDGAILPAEARKRIEAEVQAEGEIIQQILQESVNKVSFSQGIKGSTEERFAEAGQIFKTLNASLARAAEAGTISGPVAEKAQSLLRNNVVAAYEGISQSLNEVLAEYEVSASRAAAATRTFQTDLAKAFDQKGFTAFGNFLSADKIRENVRDAIEAALGPQGIAKLRSELEGSGATIDDVITEVFDGNRAGNAPIIDFETILKRSIDALPDSLGEIPLRSLPDAFVIGFKVAESVINQIVPGLESSVATAEDLAKRATVAAAERDRLEQRQSRGAETLTALFGELNAKEQLAGVDKERAEQLKAYNEALSGSRDLGYSERDAVNIARVAENLVVTTQKRNADADALKAQRSALKSFFEDGREEIRALEESNAARERALAGVKKLSIEQQASNEADRIAAQASQFNAAGKELVRKSAFALTLELLKLAEAAEALASREKNAAEFDALKERIVKETEASKERTNAIYLEIGAKNELVDATQQNIDKIIEELELNDTQIEQLRELIGLKKEATEEELKASEAKRVANQQQRAAAQLEAQFATSIADVALSSQSAEEALQGFIEQVIRLIIQTQILNLLGGSLQGTLLGKLITPTNSAKGNVFGPNIQQFARGGIPGLDDLPSVGSQFSLFQTPNGQLNSLRENNQPEAILPLGRDARGRLGVRIADGSQSNSRGGQTNITEVTNFNMNTDDDTFALNPRQARRLIGKRDRSRR